MRRNLSFAVIAATVRVLERPEHAGVQALVRDLNRIYRAQPALHERDCEGGCVGQTCDLDCARTIYSRKAINCGPPVSEYEWRS